MITKKKIVVQSKEELRKQFLDAVATDFKVPVRFLTGEVRIEAEISAKLKEINRRKTNRRTAILNLVAGRMGYDSWSNFGKQFLENIYPIEGKATEAQVNAIVKVILLRSAKAVLHGNGEFDAELQAVLEAHPRLRDNW